MNPMRTEYPNTIAVAYEFNNHVEQFVNQLEIALETHGWKIERITQHGDHVAEAGWLRVMWNLLYYCPAVLVVRTIAGIEQQALTAQYRSLNEEIGLLQVLGKPFARTTIDVWPDFDDPQFPESVRGLLGDCLENAKVWDDRVA
jgi:hypothetical protein